MQGRAGAGRDGFVQTGNDPGASPVRIYWGVAPMPGKLQCVWGGAMAWEGTMCHLQKIFIIEHSPDFVAQGVAF